MPPLMTRRGHAGLIPHEPGFLTQTKLAGWSTPTTTADLSVLPLKWVALVIIIMVINIMILAKRDSVRAEPPESGPLLIDMRRPLYLSRHFQQICTAMIAESLAGEELVP